MRARPDEWMTPARLARFSANAGEHPLVGHYVRTGDGRALKISDFLDRDAFHELALYREFFGPIGIEHQIAVTLPATPPHNVYGKLSVHTRAAAVARVFAARTGRRAGP